MREETVEKIVRLDRNIESKIICLINSELSDRISKNKVLRLKQEKSYKLILFLASQAFQSLFCRELFSEMYDGNDIFTT